MLGLLREGRGNPDFVLGQSILEDYFQLNHVLPEFLLFCFRTCFFGPQGTNTVMVSQETFFWKHFFPQPPRPAPPAINRPPFEAVIFKRIDRGGGRGEREGIWTPLAPAPNGMLRAFPCHLLSTWVSPLPAARPRHTLGRTRAPLLMGPQPGDVQHSPN